MMATYRLDTDLAFLRECSNEKLGLLFMFCTDS
ncbi:DUF3944 domain-containing protein [Providencia hangzhouensis]